jgi:NADH:ubiquinone reductase (H+-translocating)
VSALGSPEHRVVVVGGGFGGLQAVLKLRRAPVEVTLVDRRNFHLFQPLTYQVATGALSAGEITYPLRGIFKRDRNVRVLLAEVADFDLDARELHLRSVSAVPVPERLGYDTLIVAGGSHYSYFGHGEWRTYAAEVKSLESALAVRSRLLAAFEAAEAEPNADARGRVAHLRRHRRRPHRRRDGRPDRRAGPGHAPPRFPHDRSPPRTHSARRGRRSCSAELPTLAVRESRSIAPAPRRNPPHRPTVTGIDSASVTIEGRDGDAQRTASRAIVWAAGVTASSLAGRLAELTGAERDHAGRVTVESDLTLPGHPEVFAIGDMVRVRDADGASVVLPGVAPVAMQQGRYAGRVVRARVGQRPHGAFRYRDKGNLATIGRAAAVADIKGLRLSGFPAWATWLVVHLWYLIGFQNRLLVLIRWSFSFATHGRGARLITDASIRGGATRSWRGSTVRVRQRASAFSLLSHRFRFQD